MRIGGVGAFLLFAVGLASAQVPTFSGRFFQAPDGAYFAWAGSSVSAKFTGSSVSVALLASDAQNQYTVTIDDRVYPVLKKTANRTLYEIARGLAPGPHNFTLTRRTCPCYGTSAFQGLFVSGTFVPFEPSKLAAPAVRPRKIEFFGDDITIGMGNLGTPPCDPSPDYQDVMQTFGAYTARNFDAEPIFIAWNNKGAMRNYGEPAIQSARPMPTYYRNTLGGNDTIHWDFTQWVPEAVVINLGTNDFSTDPKPPLDLFTANFASNVIAPVRAVYPATTEIFVVCGPIAAAPCCQGIQDAIKRFPSDTRLHYVPMDRSVLGPNDFGCRGNPNVSGHRKMSAILISAMSKVLGW